MGEPARFQAIEERLGHMILTHKLSKCLWAPFTRDDLVGHVKSLISTSKSGQVSHIAQNYGYRCFLSDLAGFVRVADVWDLTTLGVTGFARGVRPEFESNAPRH
jgi:hypothetical protein